MTDNQEFQFHRERKKEIKEKIEYIQVWIKGLSHEGKSSWAFSLIDGKKDILFISGKNDELNIDRLHLISIIEFLEWISDGKKRSITIYTDNNYIINVLREWVDKWSYTQFKLPDGSLRPNGDLLDTIYKLKSPHILIMKQFFTKNEFALKNEDLCREELNIREV